MVDTAQKRTKVWIDAYWTAAHVTKDNGSDLATIISAYDWPDYPLTRVFIDKTIDGIISVGQPSSQAIIDADHAPIGYNEEVPITMCAVDKTGITGIKLLGKMEAELRLIGETYPVVSGSPASLRRYTGTVPKTERIGSFFLFSIEYRLNYRRDKS
jgi:hypothetical protein